MFNTAELPGRVERPARATRASCMRCSPAASRRSAARLRWIRRPNKYVAFGPRTARRQHQGLLGIRAGLLAHDADGHADRRPPLRRADAVLARQRHHVERHDGGHVRHVRPRRRRHLQQVQLLRARRVGRRRAEFKQLTKGTHGYKTDWNNFAPSVSIAWRPNVQDGFMRALLGDPEQATLRGGYTPSYERQGMAEFTGTFGANPGSTVSLTRNRTLGNLVSPGETWPVLLSQTSRLYTAPFNRVADIPDRRAHGSRRQPERLRAGCEDRPRPAPGTSASSARSRATWRSKSATSARAAGTSGRRSTTTTSAART